MNNDNKHQSSNDKEEIDLIVFFNLIGNVFKYIYSLIITILEFIFSLIINVLKVIVKNWKIILIAITIPAIVGYALEKTKNPTYQSEMLVETYFDSKFQLISNISFFNSLIRNKDYEQLEKVFNSDKLSNLDVKDIKGFKITLGTETDNDRVLQYQNFIKDLDTSGLKVLSFDKFLKSRNIYSSDNFLITAESNKKDIFKNLTNGIKTAFSNNFSTSKKKKDSLLYVLQKRNIESSLLEVKKLQQIYIQALNDQSSQSGQVVKLDQLIFSKDRDRDTKEYDLLEKELALRNQLREIEAKQIKEDVFVDIITDFQPVGAHKSEFYDRYSIVFPMYAFGLLCMFYIFKRIIIYVKNYEE